MHRLTLIGGQQAIMALTEGLNKIFLLEHEIFRTLLLLSWEEFIVNITLMQCCICHAYVCDLYLTHKCCKMKITDF